MHSLIIHMTSSTARRDNVDRLLHDLPDARVVNAVDGRDPLQIADVRRMNGNAFSPHYPFALRPAEIGVFQSHRRCWQQIVDEGWDYALIVEDDLRVDPAKFAVVLEMIREKGTADMYIRLPVKARETPAAILAERGNSRLILPRIIGLQCICQVVGRNAARRLLVASETIDRPVDTFLQMHWVTGQPVHAILPNGNAEVAQQIGGSTIQVKTRGSGKLLRELKRAWYRTLIKIRLQRPESRP